jgi:proteasome lid subunit RPN8/RPN11
MTPYPPIERWLVPEAALDETLEAVVPASFLGNESGSFLLGRRERTARMTVVVLPRGRGVEETPWYWRVGAEVYGQISSWAKPRGLSLLAILHTHLHGVPARLSRADRTRSVRAPGVLAVVIGGGGEERNLGAWGWYVYENSDYRRLDPAELAARIDIDQLAEVEIRGADADGVRPISGSGHEC